MENTSAVLKLLVTVADRKAVERVLALLKEAGSHWQIVCLGRGTANSEILDYLGLGESEKAVVFATAEQAVLQQVLAALKEQMHFDQPGSGIAFTVPLSSVGGITTLKILEGKELEHESGKEI